MAMMMWLLGCLVPKRQWLEDRDLKLCMCWHVGMRNVMMMIEFTHYRLTLSIELIPNLMQPLQLLHRASLLMMPVILPA